MSKGEPPALSRREREIMDVVYRLGGPTAAEIAEGLLDPPSYSAVRALLAILVKKGHLKTAQDGTRYRYLPATSKQVARKRALRDVVANFFQGSPKQAVVALLDEAGTKMSPEDIEEIRQMIDQARKRKG